MTKRTPAVAVLLLAAFLSGAHAKEDDDPLPGPVRSEGAGAARSERVLADDVTRDQLRAIERGLAWLADAQLEDGSWEGAFEGGGELAATCLSVLAFMGAGNTESRGKYHENVREGLKFILQHATRKGASPNDSELGYIHVKDDKYSKMHAHGYATLVLALAYGMSDTATDFGRRRREELRQCLVDAVALIERSQDDSGGWFYEPVRHSGHEGSVTVTQVQALRAAREAGIRVKPVVVDLALRYLENSQDEDTGGFCYRISDRAVSQQSYGLTAAALSTLFGLGQYDRREMVVKGLRYMKRYYEENFRGRTAWFFYANFYAAQTLWQAAATPWGRPYWDDWWPRMRELLVERCQDADGTFRLPFGRPSQDMGDAYRTAFSCLILEVPLQILPLYER